MRILHTSDWHLGAAPRGADVAAEQRAFLSRLYAMVEEENAGAVLLSGDVFDSGLTGAESVALYSEAATEICQKRGARMVVIAGNHDSAARLCACRSLLRGAGLHVFGRLGDCDEPVLLDGGRVAVYPVPFFGRDEAIERLPDRAESIRSFPDAFRAVMDDIRARMDPSRFNIVMAHAFVVGGELSDSDRAAAVGSASAVPLSTLSGFDYVALGHLHGPQRLSETVRYAGSPVQLSFGKEEAQVKGVTLVDTEARACRFLPLEPLHPRRTVRGTFREVMDATGLENFALRVQLTDRVADTELLERLRARFPHLAEIYGMNEAPEAGAGALSIEDLERLDDTGVLLRFFQDLYGETPGAGQVKLFEDALQGLEDEKA